MFAHNKRLMYTVRVSETNPKLGSLMLEQFGGPQEELAAAMRYFRRKASMYFLRPIDSWVVMPHLYRYRAASRGRYPFLAVPDTD